MNSPFFSLARFAVARIAPVLIEHLRLFHRSTRTEPAQLAGFKQSAVLFENGIFDATAYVDEGVWHNPIYVVLDDHVFVFKNAGMLSSDRIKVLANAKTYRVTGISFEIVTVGIEPIGIGPNNRWNANT